MSVASARGEAERLDVLFEAAPFAWLVCDEGGRVLRANAAADRLFARGRGGLEGSTVAALLPGLPLHAGEVSSASATATVGGTTVECVAHVWPWAIPTGGKGFAVALTHARQAVLS